MRFEFSGVYCLWATSERARAPVLPADLMLAAVGSDGLGKGAKERKGAKGEQPKTVKRVQQPPRLSCRTPSTHDGSSGSTRGVAPSAAVPAL